MVQGDIQISYVERFRDDNSVELAVFYPKNFTIDEKMKKSIMFEHFQRNRVFEYISKTDADKNPNCMLTFRINK